MNDHPAETAPADGYTPDESAMRALFARPARPARPKRETWVAGHAFDGIPGEEADRLRWENLHRRPVRVKDKEEDQ
jgi:hypothetical protein